MCGSGRLQPFDDGQAADQLGPVERQLQAGQSARRVTDDMGRTADRLDDLGDVVRHVAHRVGRGQGAVAAAGAALVVEHDPVAGRQRLHLRREEGPRAAEPGRQQDDLVARAVHLVVQAVDDPAAHSFSPKRGPRVVMAM